MQLWPDWRREQLKMRLERWEVLDHAPKTMVRNVMREGRQDSRMSHHKHSLSQGMELNVISESCWQHVSLTVCGLPPQKTKDQHLQTHTEGCSTKYPTRTPQSCQSHQRHGKSDALSVSKSLRRKTGQLNLLWNLEGISEHKKDTG